MTRQRVYACTLEGVPQVVVLSDGFDHVPATEIAAFLVAAIAPALDKLDGDRWPRRFPRRVNHGGSLLIEVDSFEDANRLRNDIDRLDPVDKVRVLVAALYPTVPA